MPLKLSMRLMALSITLVVPAGLHAQSDYAMSPVQFPSAFSVNAMTQVGETYDAPSTETLLDATAFRDLPKVAAVSLNFRPSIARRKANLQTFVNKMRARDAQGAAAMQQLMASGDIIATMGRELNALGLDVNNVADAYAVYWVNAWQAAHQDDQATGRELAQAVRIQSGNALSRTSKFASATEAQKQEFAEALLVQAALISAAQEKYRNDAKLSRQLAAAVRQGAKASGLDLDAMTLTPNGFVPADRRGAAETGTALAGNDNEGTKPSYGLLAAAGGAGFAAVYLLGRASGRRG